jgi:hypothetical protein
MTEGYRRRNFGNLEVEVTLSDPDVYARPWTVAVRAELAAADTEMIEWVCMEGDRGLEHWVGKASDERKGEVQVAPEILPGTSVRMKSSGRSGEPPLVSS